MNLIDRLKDCEEGTILYTLPFGECYYIRIEDCSDYPQIIVRSEDGAPHWFNSDGTYSPTGEECLIFPSKEIRDWYLFGVPYVIGNPVTPDITRKLLKDNGGKDEGYFDFAYTDKDTIYYIYGNLHVIRKTPIKSNLGQLILMTGKLLELSKVEEPKEPKQLTMNLLELRAFLDHFLDNYQIAINGQPVTLANKVTIDLDKHTLSIKYENN